MEQIKDFLKEVLHTTYESKLQLNDSLALEIISNSANGIGKKFFSKDVFIDDTQIDSECIRIYNVNYPYEKIPKDILLFAEKNGLRSKRMLKGYYSLHHFGNPVCYFAYEGCYYLIGDLSDNNKILWSYITKLILTIHSWETENVHLKGSLISDRSGGILIVGDKASGKTTFIHNLMMKFPEMHFISNTHILSDGNQAAGLLSNINIRKDMLERIQIEDQRLLNVKLKSCNNIDPIDLEYNILKKTKIETIIFLSYNKSCNLEIKRTSDDRMKSLISCFGNAIHAYNLQNDLLEYLNKDALKFSDYVARQEHILENLVMNKRNFTVSIDMLCENKNELFLELKNELFC